MLHGLLTALVSTILWVVAQNLWMHIRPNPRRVQAILTGYILSLPLVYCVYRWMPVLLETFPHEALAMGWVHAYLLHFLLFAFYGECFFHVERSVTLRLLVEILHAGPQGAGLEVLRSQYPVGQMVAQRLEVLRKNGFLREENGRWQLQRKAKLLARFAVLGNWLLCASAQNERG